jgi:hypothetical protein
MDTHAHGSKTKDLSVSIRVNPWLKLDFSASCWSPCLKKSIRTIVCVAPRITLHLPARKKNRPVIVR